MLDIFSRGSPCSIDVQGHANYCFVAVSVIDCHSFYAVARERYFEFFAVEFGPGGKRGAGVPGCGKRGVWWKTRGKTFFAKIKNFPHYNEKPNFVSLYCDKYQFSISANVSLVFFRAVYFIFHSNLLFFTFAPFWRAKIHFNPPNSPF